MRGEYVGIGDLFIRHQSMRHDEESRRLYPEAPVLREKQWVGDRRHDPIG